MKKTNMIRWVRGANNTVKDIVTPVLRGHLWDKEKVALYNR